MTAASVALFNTLVSDCQSATGTSGCEELEEDTLLEEGLLLEELTLLDEAALLEELTLLDEGLLLEELTLLDEAALLDEGLLLEEESEELELTEELLDVGDGTGTMAMPLQRTSSIQR